MIYTGTIESGELVGLCVRRDGAVVASHRPPATLDVTIDGRTVRVEVPYDAYCDGARSVERGAWSELHAKARDLDSGLVPPFAEVELDVLRFAAGDEIAFAGEVDDAEFLDDGGPREAPTQIERIHATAIASGRKARQLVEAELERRGAKQSELPAPAAKAVARNPMYVLIVAIAGGMGLGFGYLEGDLHRVPVALVGLAGVLFASRPLIVPPTFWERDKPRLTRDTPTIIFACAGLLGVVVVPMIDLGAPGWLATLAAVAATLFVAARPSYRALRALVAAPPMDRGDGWVQLEGNVDHPEAKGAVLSAVTSYSEYNDNVEVKGRSVTGPRRIRIRCANGLVVVERDHAIWGTFGTRSERGAFDSSRTEAIGNGDAIAACGKLVKGPGSKLALQSDHAQPVVLLAARTGSPIAIARQILRHRWISVAALAVCAIAVAAQMLAK